MTTLRSVFGALLKKTRSFTAHFSNKSSFSNESSFANQSKDQSPPPGQEDVLNAIKLSKLFGQAAPNRVFLAIVLGSLAGFAYSIMIPLVLMSLRPPPSRLLQVEGYEPFMLFGTFEVSTPKLALAFFLLCMFILLCQASSQTLLSRVAIEMTKRLRMDMYRRISRLPIQDLERIGPSRLMAGITADIPGVISGAAVFPELVVNIATLLGLLGFLIYLNLPVFVFIILTILAGAMTYQLPIYIGSKYIERARHRFDLIHESIRGLIYGAKELKINQQRQQSYLNQDLFKLEQDQAQDDKRGQTFIVFGTTYGNLISFFAIGCVTYVMANYYALSQEHLTGVVMVMLYITGPIAALINAVGPIARASVSARKLQGLKQDMPVEAGWGKDGVIDCERLALKGLTFAYQNKNLDESFHVGPIDLTLNRGEITFLVGGNGSGKTTLAKMLSLHYLPESGSLLFDDIEVTPENREACRQSVSAIYTDFYLFTRLFGIDNPQIQALANRYIQDLHLSGKVEVRDGQFSGTALSDGQKKRLALLVTYLENRSIYVFDEWAADQDPVFREIFYRQILPSLKAMNKLVIVISHDDRYFDVADKVVRMENGKVHSVQLNHPDQNQSDLTRSSDSSKDITMEENS
ncbi:cyclic peptide export ABC transporter [Paraneptunicella aestuarii]|uniref:cyclic peptide export ABC transporter n=1 Tax=Paraneptunicella aestuarii TaxID=2831148 RepID=UPI001E58C3D5|nr:cyclic peptide export ABC transporter [Paraneptunicella aestuarii]UAA39973.1 cyclic peptide export ABC transporter [Paraneptunicella aestuarii]